MSETDNSFLLILIKNSLLYFKLLKFIVDKKGFSGYYKHNLKENRKAGTVK